MARQRTAPPSPSPAVFRLSDFDAQGDGIHLETKALQAAIDACGRIGGGTVSVPAGRYRTGTIFLRSRVTLDLDAGAILLGSEEPDDYPVVQYRWEGAEQDTYAPLIAGRDLERIAITGRGTIDGCGAVWWKRFAEKSLAHPRPRLIALSDCEDVRIEGVTLINSPSWTINPIRCVNVQVRGVTILNPPDSPNTDGINPDSCRQVRISDCTVSVGDDCITLKSGTEFEQADKRAPCRDIVITNCTLARGHGGVVIGSETNGCIQNVVISDCVFQGTDRGIRLKTRRGRGGVVEDIRASNLTMTDVQSPFTINLYYGCGAWGDPHVSDKNPRPLGEGTPRIRRIHLSNITAREVKLTAGFLYGLAEMPLEEVSLSDISVTLSAQAAAGFPEMADGFELMQRAGFFCCNARDLTLHNVEISGQLGPAFRLQDCEQVTVDSCGTATPDPSTPVISLRNVQDSLLKDCQTGSKTEVFLHVEGARSQHVELTGHSRIQAGTLIQCADDVPAREIRITPQAAA